MRSLIARIRAAAPAALALFAALLLAAPLAHAETRVALVIGNSAYAHGGRLANPSKDAALVAQSLRRVGFTVIAQDDLGKDALEAALKSFTRAAAGADVALVYYAGHGIEKGGTNYLVPVDAGLDADTDIDFEAVPLDLVMHSVGGATRLKIVILDACRNNPFRDTMRRSAGTRGIGQGLAKPPDPEEGDMLVAYAAEAGSTAEDGAGDNSPFATALARHIPDPGIDVRIMFGRIRDDVRDATNRRQEPAVYESLGGEQFYMAPGAAAGSAAPRIASASAAPDARTMDLTFWQSVEASNDAAQLNAYLSQYPHGAFAALARAKIDALAHAQPAPPAGAADQSATRGESPAGEAGPFDGQWEVLQQCPRSPDGADAYTFDFLGEVRNSRFRAQRGTTDHPGWLSLDGLIRSDGSAKLDAHGRTGQARFNISHAVPGTEFHHLVTARFDRTHGQGEWVAVRVCSFTFTRQ